MGKLANPDGPRVPRHGIADLINRETTIQGNHCRKPSCENYGAPPRTMPGKTGPNPNRDPNYKLHSTNQGLVPALLCKACGENPPIKSNRCITEEVDRLVKVDGWRTLEEKTACKTSECDNFGCSVAHHPKEYVKRGFSRSGGQYYQCKRCRRQILASTARPLHKGNQAHAADVFSRIANKAPIRGVFRGSGLNSTAAYYRILDFIHARCRAYSAAIDRALIDGRMRLPERMVIESDAQSYMLNWASRLDQDAAWRGPPAPRAYPIAVRDRNGSHRAARGDCQLRARRSNARSASDEPSIRARAMIGIYPKNRVSYPFSGQKTVV